MIPAIDVHSHYFYLLDLKLIIFWYSPGSVEWIFFCNGFFHKKKTGYFFHTANAHMSTVQNSAHHRKSIDKALMEAIKCITEVSDKQQHILTVQGSLCIDPFRGFLLSGQCHIWKQEAAP